nr:RecName: Full=Cytochrome c oxidase subunit 6A, mitochondrial; AltName: Full=Cytochrome c oxidase polypeptide VIa [Thunnus obesus]
KEQPEFVPY